MAAAMADFRLIWAAAMAGISIFSDFFEKKRGLCPNGLRIGQVADLNRLNA